MPVSTLSERLAKHALILACALPLLILAVGEASARQYESEQRIIPDSDANGNVNSDPETLLGQLEGNDYGKALLLRQLAAVALKKNQHDKATEYLRRAMRLNALSEYAQEDMQRALVHLYASTGQHQKLIDALGSTWKSDNTLKPEFLVALGNAYAQLKRYSKALGPVTKGILDSDSPDETWLRLKLQIELELQRYRNASKTIEALIRQIPTDRELWLQLANLQLRLKNDRKAVATLALAHQQNMLLSAEERLFYIRMLYKTGAPYQAATLLQRWLKNGELSDSHATQALLANAWVDAKERKRAASAMRTVAKRENNADTWLRLAKLEVDLGRWAAAAAALRKALGIGGLGNNQGAALMTLGIAEFQQGNAIAATEVFNQALDISNTAALAEQWLDYLLFEEKKKSGKS